MRQLMLAAVVLKAFTIFTGVTALVTASNGSIATDRKTAAVQLPT
jgi:hypothetical protein